MLTYKGDLDIEETPNESGIFRVATTFDVPKDGDGFLIHDNYELARKQAGQEIGLYLEKADVLDVVGPEESNSLRRQENDMMRRYRMGVTVVPESSVPKEKVKNLQKENTRLRQRIRSLEDKLSKIKNTLPDGS